MDDKTDRLSDKGKNEFLENVVVAEADHIPGEENIDEAKARPAHSSSYRCALQAHTDFYPCRPATLQLIRRVDFVLIPWLSVLYLLSFLDRTVRPKAWLCTCSSRPFIADHAGRALVNRPSAMPRPLASRSTSN